MSTYEEGRQARRDGQSRDANPHDERSPLKRLWDEGWTDSDSILRAMEPYQ